MTLNLANIGFQITGIPGVDRLTNGDLRLEQTGGQDLFTVVSNEAGNSSVEMHTRSKDFVVSIEMPRVGPEAMNLQDKLHAWSSNPATQGQFFSVSFKVTDRRVISSSQCVLEWTNWDGLQLSAESQKVTFRIKMINAGEL